MADKRWDPPEFVYLQIEDEHGNIAKARWDAEIYWCDERIYKSDVKYRKVDYMKEDEE